MSKESDIIINDMSDGVIVIGQRGDLQQINPAGGNLLELDKMNLPSNFSSLFIGDKRNDAFVQTILDALKSDHAAESNLCEYYPSQGVKKYFEVKPTYMINESGEKQLIIVLSDITKQQEALIYRKDTTLLVSLLFICLCLYLFVYKYVISFVSATIEPSSFTMPFLGVLLIMECIIIKTTTIRPYLVFRGAKARKAVINSLIISACLVIFMVFVKFLLAHFGLFTVSAEKPFCDFSKFTFKEIYRYIPSVLIQEFIARSVVQECLVYVFGNKHATLAIVVSSMLFGAVHFTFSFTVMIGAMVLMFALGVFYHNNRNLIAVSIVHYVFAECAIILGFI